MISCDAVAEIERLTSATMRLLGRIASLDAERKTLAEELVVVDRQRVTLLLAAGAHSRRDRDAA